MKTPEEIKKALKQCDDPKGSCAGCPFDTLDRCEKNAVVLEYIEQLEERIAIMGEGNKTITNCNTLKMTVMEMDRKNQDDQ